MRRRQTAVTKFLAITVLFVVMASQLIAYSRRIEPPTATLSPDQSLILQYPHKFAWQIFAAINRPEPNDGDRNVAWENWMEESEVYQRDADKPEDQITPVWHSRGKRSKKVHELIEDIAFNPMSGDSLVLKQLANASDSSRATIQAVVPPKPGSSDSSRLSEVRINPIAFNSILDKEIWYLRGQKNAFSNASQDPIVFKPGAREVKANWTILEKESDKERYHWQKIKLSIDGKCTEKIIGLNALSITTKDLPNWFWATWEHVDNKSLCAQLDCDDPFGSWPPITNPDQKGDPTDDLKQLLKMNGLGSEWQNYRLVGVQTDFTDSTGSPVLLGNSILEGRNIPLASSSCMTCHSRSTIDINGNRLSQPSNKVFIGAPNQDWFYTFSAQGRRRLYMTFDFVWSVSKVDHLNAPPQTEPCE